MRKWKFAAYLAFSVLTSLFVVSPAAQFESKGKLKVWTRDQIQRNHDTENRASGLCKVRVARYKDFDRVVFEFDEGRVNWVLQYLPSNIYPTEGGDRQIKLAGNNFLVINFYGIAPGEAPCELKNYPTHKLNFPTLRQIQEGVWFEGIQDFLIGVSEKKPFRVQELSHPTRLVIDFKH